jgi:hypothetical protein
MQPVIGAKFPRTAYAAAYVAEAMDTAQRGMGLD